MMKKSSENNVYKWIIRILTVGVILVNIKNAFTNFNIDAEYAIAMSYRMVQGDGMFAQLWEPHQTSGFLAAFFIWIYLALFQTTTGIAVYLNVVGLLIKLSLAVLLYRTLKPTVDSKVLYLLCLFFAAVNPKNMLLPEFSNMQLWFSVLLFCALFLYFREQKKRWLFAAIPALCLVVLAYPTSALVYVGVVVILAIYSEKKWRDIGIVTVGCLLTGGVYVGYFVAKLGLPRFLEGVKYIVSGDETHNTGMLEKCGAYFLELGQVLMLVAVCALVSAVVVVIWSRFKNIDKKKWFLAGVGVSLCIYQFVSTLIVGDRYMYLALYVTALVIGIWACRFCDKREKQIYVIGAVITLCNLIATLILTNLTFLTSVAYAVLGVALAFIPISKACDALSISPKLHWKYGILLLFCAVTVFRGGFLIRGMQEENTGVFDVLQAGGIVKDGPTKWIVSDYMGPYIMNATYAEWGQYVKPGDKVFMVGPDKISVIGYLYEDVEICTDSTICTPTYNEKLLTYWENNPEKYPNVIVVSCWYGELQVREDSWIMQWIENEFSPDESYDGSYWRYYRKK